MSEPTSIRAGDSVSWTRATPDRKAGDGWALYYRLLWPTGAAVDINTTAAGDDHTAALTAAETAGYPAGDATLAAWLVKGIESITLGQYPVSILPDLRTTQNLDGRSPSEKALADARSALHAYAAGDATVMTVSIGDVSTTFRSTRDLVELINSLEQAVNRERAALAMLNGTGVPGRVFTRM